MFDAAAATDARSLLRFTAHAAILIRAMPVYDAAAMPLRAPALAARYVA